MSKSVVRSRKVPLRLVAGLSVLIVAACGPSTPPPVATPPVAARPDPLRDGDAAFQAEEYAIAARAYRRGLEDAGSAPGPERVLYRLAMIYALPGSPVQNLEESRRYLGQLVAAYPDADGAVAVQALWSLHSTAESLESTISSLRDDIALLEADSLARSAEITDLHATLTSLQEELAATLAELDKLRAIDLGRRRE